MIIIQAPTAQTASDTLDLKPPPALTIGAEFGSFVLKGSKYTSAYCQPKGSEFYGQALPKDDYRIPVIGENEVVLIKEINPQTIAGVMRAMGLDETCFTQEIVSSFWNELKYTHKKEIDLRVKKTIEYIEDKRLATSHYIYNTDVSEIVKECVDFIVNEINNPITIVENNKNLDTWVSSSPYNIVVRKSISEDTSEMFTDPTGHTNDVCISYKSRKGEVIISSTDQRINCRDFSTSKWGLTWGRSSKSGSPALKVVTEEEFKETIKELTEYVKEKTYRM